MRPKMVPKLVSVFLPVMALAAGTVSAQSKAYRQSNFTSDLSDTANSVAQDLLNPWGITFLPGQPFFIADNNSGGVTSYDASGAPVMPFRFLLPNPNGTALDSPTGIVADQNSSFGGRSLIKPFIVVTDEGRVFVWAPDAQGDLPQEATLALNQASSNASFKGAAILNSAVTTPVLAITNFRDALVDTFLPGFDPVATAGPFLDPNLPAGFAPFGISVIGSQVFVTYALQDATKQNPVPGAGNGLVNTFDLEGNFVGRFATGGPLNAPWGLTQAPANFGPFSNAILIGNSGDGAINAFDAASGNFLGQIQDGDGNAIVNSGLHGLTFRSDGFGDANTLYLTAGTNNGQDGLFAGITAGLVSHTSVSVPTTQTDTPAPITVTVSPGPGNPGAPTGQVSVEDNGIPLAVASLINGQVSFSQVLTGAGTHVIKAQYSGDATFLPSSSQTEMQVTGLSTTLSLVAPAVAAPGSSVTLTATINSAGGTPTGQIEFHDGNTELGISPLDNTGVATLSISAFAAGVHSLTASYGGDGKFEGSTSAAVAISVANPDFSLGAAPASATVIAGQSTQFTLTVTAAGGFANTVTFSCSPVAGITCSFTPSTIAPAGGVATATLTLTTSATVTRYGLLPIRLVGPAVLLGALAFVCFVCWRGGNLFTARPSFLATAGVLLIVGFSFTLGGCGNYGSNMQTNRGTASIMVMAQAGSISHTTALAVTVQ